MEHFIQEHENDSNFEVHVHAAGPIDSEGNVRCYKHQLLAQSRISNTQRNPEREFYSCAKEFSDPERCNFFLWADEILSSSNQEKAENSAAPSSLSSWSESPRSSQETPYMTEQSSSQPIACWNTSDGLNASRSSPSIILDSIYPAFNSNSALTGLDSGEPDTINSSPPSNNYFRSSSEEQCLWDALQGFSEAGNGSPPPMPNVQPTSVQRHVDSADQLRRHPVGAATWGAPLRSTGTRGESASNLAPPNSGSGTTAAVKASAGTKKGFGRPPGSASGTILTDDMLAPSRAGGVTDGRQKISAKVPLHARDLAAPARWRAKEFGAPVRRSTPRLVKPSHSQSLSATVPDLPLSGDAVSAHLGALSHLPDYIRKLERKQVAAEKSIHMKTRRIAELEEEVRRLKSENADLLKNSRRIQNSP